MTTLTDVTSLDNRLANEARADRDILVRDLLRRAGEAFAELAECRRKAEFWRRCAAADQDMLDRLRGVDGRTRERAAAEVVRQCGRVRDLPGEVTVVLDWPDVGLSECALPVLFAAEVADEWCPSQGAWLEFDLTAWDGEAHRATYHVRVNHQEIPEH